MRELFPNVSQKVRNDTQFWVQTSLTMDDPFDGIKKVLNYRDTLQTEEEKAFVDFYFNLIIEGLKEQRNG